MRRGTRHAPPATRYGTTLTVCALSVAGHGGEGVVGGFGWSERCGLAAASFVGAQVPWQRAMCWRAHLLLAAPRAAARVVDVYVVTDALRLGSIARQVPPLFPAIA